MCKVCRLWGVLSQALFSYACRPNFHHKYLTLTDPLLSVCEEALISLHTCADRPKILRLELRMNVGGKVWVSVCVHAYVCLHDCVKQLRTVLHALIILQVPFFDLSLISRSSAGRHSSLQKETTSNEESLSWGRDTVLSLLFSSVSFLFSAVLGQVRKIQQINTCSCEINIYCLW